MGAVAGWLMGLHGTLGLAGWQWLFLVEGFRRRYSVSSSSGYFPTVQCRLSGSRPKKECGSKRQLDHDSSHAHLGHEAGVMQALLSPKVWMIGAYFLCALTANYAYYFSAPVILQERQAGASRTSDF